MAFPILASAPKYISESITLGALMESAQGFSQAVGALSWGVNSLPGIAAFKASAKRVLSLIDAIDEIA
jgi:putative ATP-binding cassette transporter